MTKYKVQKRHLNDKRYFTDVWFSAGATKDLVFKTEDEAVELMNKIATKAQKRKYQFRVIKITATKTVAKTSLK